MKLIHRGPIKTFPFGRVAGVMKAIGWTWVGTIGRTPNSAEIQLEASQLLRRLMDLKGDSLASGGVVAFRDGTVGFEAMSGKRRQCFAAWEKGARHGDKNSK